MRWRDRVLTTLTLAAIAVALYGSVAMAAGQKRSGAKSANSEKKVGQMSKEAKAAGEAPIMCVLGNFDEKQMKRHQELRQQVWAKIQETRELADGYALRLPGEKEMILSVAEFITLERQCCPFFSFALEVERDQNSIWLKLTGGEGVKEFLKSQMEIR